MKSDSDRGRSPLAGALDNASVSDIAIAGRPIGPNHPPYIIAELSANHMGDLERALKLVEVAASTGVDAVKLQTYTPDTITLDHDGPDFRIRGGLWDGRTLYDLYEEAHTPWEWHKPLFEKGRALGVAVFSSPFDDTAVDLLESLGAPAYKIASFEAVDLPLIERVARAGRPMIVSTGMADRTEIGEAVNAARGAGCGEIVLLHCVSGYPAPAEDSNLRTIPDLQARFAVQCGLSDHTLGTGVATAAVALGATVIEKHFTLSRADGGPDGAFSLEPAEFKTLVADARTAWAALGRINYDRAPSEQQNAQFRRSLYVVKDIAAGETWTREHVRSIRPGHGLAPKHLNQVLGRVAARNVSCGTPLDWGMLKDL
ncbi:MAG: pseudaminic acid synthase [Minwuiales bacterium]|nr:pseudaminic acid synthase [Minwuiales bacterium]